VDDPLDRPVLRHDGRERGEDPVANVALDDLEMGRPGVLGEARAFAGAEVIEHGNSVTAGDQRVDRMRSDQPRASCDHRER
jgi:hypothetical protein